MEIAESPSERRRHVARLQTVQWTRGNAMSAKDVVNRLAVLVLTGTLVIASGCQAVRSSSPAGDFDAKDSAHPRHATGIDSHVGDY